MTVHRVGDKPVPATADPAEPDVQANEAIFAEALALAGQTTTKAISTPAKTRRPGRVADGPASVMLTQSESET